MKCFTYSQVRKITAELKKGEICDSITQLQQLQIINFKDVLKVNDKIILENKKRLSEVNKTLNKTELKLRISKRLTMFGVPIAFGTGILTVILLK